MLLTGLILSVLLPGGPPAGAAAGVQQAAPPAGTSTAPFVLSAVVYNPPGRDTARNANAERVVITNTGHRPARLHGWRLADDRGAVFARFGRKTVPSGTAVTVHSGRGSNDALHRYWQRDRHAWDNRRGRLRLIDPGGTVRATCAWSGGGTATSCGPAQWPKFMQDARHTGLSPSRMVAGSTAADLRPVWQAQTGASTYASPVVAHSAVLGKTVVYTGNKAGVLTAHDAATGDPLWTFKAAGAISSTPAVVADTVYVGSSDTYLYALDASTGARRCRYSAGGVIVSSPTVVTVEGVGRVVYVGDSGATGGDDGGALHAVHGVDENRAANCSGLWRYDAFGEPAGSQPLAGVWSPPAYAFDRRGRPLVVFGGSSPDNAAYALDARTGERVWRFQTETLYPDNDVGAGVTLLEPGSRGAPDGLAYVQTKNNIVYGLNLRTGAKAWEFRIRDDSPATGGAARSTPALVDGRLYLGYGAGVYALDAVNGAKIWKTQDYGLSTAEVISSPAVAGPPDDPVVVVGDLAGMVHAFDATGARVWSHSTGGLVYASAAIAADRILIGSHDGYLYAFAPDRSAAARPDTVLASPATGSTVDNDTSDLTLAGSASDDRAVGRVEVAIRAESSGRWWNGTTRTWESAYVTNVASLASAGSKATSWDYSFAAPFNGGEFFAQAEAIDDRGRRDPVVAKSTFTVRSLGNAPETSITEPVFKQVYPFPAQGRQPVPVTIRGTAVDSGGARPGISKVLVVIRNVEHGDHWCGPSCADGAPDAHNPHWTAARTAVEATLQQPGHPSTEWSLTFWTYDHPHKYHISAAARDLDGERDPVPAMVDRICVRDPGDNSCV